MSRYITFRMYSLFPASPFHSDNFAHFAAMVEHLSEVWLGGEHRTTEYPSLAELLEVVDETEKRSSGAG